MNYLVISMCRAFSCYRSVTARIGSWRLELIEHQGLLEQWKYSVWYHNDGYMSWYLCLNSAHTPRVNLNINYRLWVILCQCRIINFDKCTTEKGDVNGEAMNMWGQELYGKCVYLPLNFSVNLKLLFKTKSQTSCHCRSECFIHVS